MVVEVFEGGWLELGEDVSRVRVIVARHPAPPPEKNIPVGKRVGEWVYELFITTLDADGFLVEDVLDLYHGRGADRGRCSPMKRLEEDPDRWCSYTECGQELWQIACQWVWNLRLSLGKTMQGVPVRDTLVVPSQRSSCCLRRRRTSTARVWPVAAGCRVRTRHGAFRGGGLRVARGREATLPSRGQAVVERSASRKCLYESSPSTWPIRRIVSPVLCESSVWQKAAKGDRARRVSAVRRLLPPPAPVPVERKPVLLGPIWWVDVAGRALRRTWMTHWRRQYVEILPLVGMPPSFSPPPRPPQAVRSHSRWSWQDRLACNAWLGPPQLRITVAGVPAFLSENAN